MTLEEFTGLSPTDRMVQVVDHGEFLAEEGVSNFYALGEFYVEVVLDDDAGCILALHPFIVGQRYERMLALRSATPKHQETGQPH
jgi:hypothetical protein